MAEPSRSTPTEGQHQYASRSFQTVMPSICFLGNFAQHLRISKLHKCSEVVSGNPVQKQSVSYRVDVGPFPHGSDAFWTGLIYMAVRPHCLFCFASRGRCGAHRIDISRVSLEGQCLRSLHALLSVSWDPLLSGCMQIGKLYLEVT